MGIPLPDDLKRLIDQPVFVHVATIGADGSPHNTVMWVTREGDRIVLNTADGRAKWRNLRRDPRLSISLSPPDQPYVNYSISGRVVEMRTSDGDRVIDGLGPQVPGEGALSLQGARRGEGDDRGRGPAHSGRPIGLGGLAEEAGFQQGITMAALHPPAPPGRRLIDPGDLPWPPATCARASGSPGLSRNARITRASARTAFGLPESRRRWCFFGVRRWPLGVRGRFEVRLGLNRPDPADGTRRSGAPPVQVTSALASCHDRQAPGKRLLIDKPVFGRPSGRQTRNLPARTRQQGEGCHGVRERRP